MSQSMDLYQVCEWLIMGLTNDAKDNDNPIKRKIINKQYLSRQEWTSDELHKLAKGDKSFCISTTEKAAIKTFYDGFMNDIVIDVKNGNIAQITGANAPIIAAFGTVAKSSEEQVGQDWIYPLFATILKPKMIKHLLQDRGDGCSYDIVFEGAITDFCIETKNLGYRCRHIPIKTKKAWEDYSMGTGMRSNHLTTTDNESNSDRGLVVPTRQVVDYMQRRGSNSCSSYGLYLLTNGTTFVLYLLGDDTLSENELKRLQTQANSDEIKNLFATIKQTDNTDREGRVHFPIYKVTHRPIFVCNVKTTSLKYDWENLGLLKGIILSYMSNGPKWKQLLSELHKELYNRFLDI